MAADRIEYAVLNASLPADRLEQVPPAVLRRDPRIGHHLSGEFSKAVLRGLPATPDLTGRGGGQEKVSFTVLGLIPWESRKSLKAIMSAAVTLATSSCFRKARRRRNVLR